LKTEDYPPLYQESDLQAINAQKRHFMFVRAKIAFLVIIAATMSISWEEEPGFRTNAAALLATLLVISTAFTAIASARRYDQDWLNFRAIAESIKTEAWLFMMQVKPYDEGITEIHAEDRYLKRSAEVIYRRPSTCSRLALHLKESPQITKQMREMRNETFERHRDFYVQERIGDQITWYVQKAKWNRRRESFWFAITWLLELSAALTAIIVIILTNTFINPVGIITTAGAGVLSWINARSYSEPAESYGFVAQELVLLRDRAKAASTNQGLSKVVLETETTINQEHTIWMARV
jgi:hypothetical protein